MFIYSCSTISYSQIINDSLSEKKLFERKANVNAIGLLGGGIFISGVYDRIIYEKSDQFVSIHLGIGFALSGASFPHGLSINFGKRNNYFEMGIEGTYLTSLDLSRFSLGEGSHLNEYGSYNIFPNIGYRYQAFDGGSMFKIYGGAFIPLISSTPEGKFVAPWIGFQLGICY